MSVPSVLDALRIAGIRGLAATAFRWHDAFEFTIVRKEGLEVILDVFTTCLGLTR